MSDYKCNATNCTGISGSASRESCFLKPEEYYRTVLPWLYLCLAVFGLLTNGAALLQLWRSERTTTDIFNLNIMMSDLMVCCSFPFRSAYYRDSSEWKAGSAPCIAIEFLSASGFYTNLYCNMGFLLWTSINRFATVVRPRGDLFRTFQQPWFCRVICLTTWVLGVTSVCSFTGYTSHKAKSISKAKSMSCFEQMNGSPVNTNVAHAVGVGVFFFILALMVLSYGLLIFHLHKVMRRSLVGEGLGPGGGLRVRRKILASVLLFMACFLPYHVQRVRMMTTRGDDCEETRAALRAKTLTIIVAALSCCLHPALHLLLRLACCRAQRHVHAPPKAEGSQNHGTSHVHTLELPQNVHAPPRAEGSQNHGTSHVHTLELPQNVHAPPKAEGSQNHGTSHVHTLELPSERARSS